jgi:adenylylsulfate kinase
MPGPADRNLTWHAGLIGRVAREKLLGQRGCVIWLTGLSAAGKSTIARALELRLVKQQHFAYVLDGDNVRHGLNRDLGFSPEHRNENIRRIAEVAHLFADAGVIAITAFISPYRAERDHARELAGEFPFIEVYVATSLAECEKRDPKGLYKKARSGQIREFTGIDAPYESPLKPEITLDTSTMDVETCVESIIAYIDERDMLFRADTGIVPPKAAES